MDVLVNNHPAKALLDTGASENFINESLVERLGVIYEKRYSNVTMVSKELRLATSRRASLTLTLFGKTYNNTYMDVMANACADVILGQKFLGKHETVKFEFGGNEGVLSVPAKTHNYVSLAVTAVDSPRIFEHLTSECKPIATRSRNYTNEDQRFIASEVQRLFSEDIIEPSTSAWRAQVLVVRKSLKCWLVVDYYQTINRFTLLDAYLLPKIEDIVNKVGKDRFYSSLDLKSAYHQVTLQPQERHFTVFEALGQLYQFKKLSFGVTNGAFAFHRVIDKFIKRHNLKKVYAYLDDLTVTGCNSEEHAQNLKALLKAAKQDGLTFNEKKSKLRQKVIYLLGYQITYNTVKPDPDRLKPLLKMAPPTTPKELKSICGMFAYYAKWIENFSAKAAPLIKAEKFPLEENALESFQMLKENLINANLGCIHHDMPFTIESDASDYAIAAILSQRGRPVAFLSRMLNACERKYPTIEKEATAVIEAVHKWSHFLKCRPFTLVTDQRSVSYMFSKKNHGKIKNTKIMLWRLELSQYHYEIQHKLGKDHIAPDAHSRVCCATEPRNKLLQLHESLGHPGYARLYHFIRSRNLPYTSEETKEVCRNCAICAEIKPRFHRAKEETLVKATRPWERLATDFKGPVKGPSPYLLVVVDEFSRYPFVFPCKNLSSSTVIECLSSLFCTFGFPFFVHSDRGPSFMSNEIKTFFCEQDIATSHSSPYHPKGNGQCERANQTIWRMIKLLLRSSDLQEYEWEKVLPKALHAIRSLLCRTTNQTPHERLFSFPRRAMAGTGMPSWLLREGTKVAYFYQDL